MNCILENVKLENTDTVTGLLIKINNINNLKWQDPNYVYNIAKLDIYESIEINSDNFIELIKKNFYNKKLDINNIILNKDIIFEEPNYIYELLYIDLEDNEEYKKEEYINDVGTLLITNGKKIYFNCLILKTYLSSLSDSMLLYNINIEDIKKILFSRANKKIIVYDDSFKEEILLGDLELFAKSFFEDEYYKKIEFNFLLYNINIWYTKELGEFNICGKLIIDPIDKCIIFTKINEDNIGNITLEEFEKIKFLSNKLTTFQTPSKFLEEKIDNYNRKIINNKYKILDLMFNEFNNKI